MKKFLISVLCISASGYAVAQSVKFETDAIGRGYIDRPYLRYEAQQGMCQSVGGEFIKADPYSQDQLASEASALEALSLTGKGSMVGWVLDEDANALTVRFSLPDSDTGQGTRQTVEIYDNDTKIADLELDSYWAWQYTTKANVGEKYPDNTPSDSKFARMRFDEASLLLPVTVEKGHMLKIVKASDAPDPVTIDFVEAEYDSGPLLFEDIEADNKIEFTGSARALTTFVLTHPGMTIYIPAGVYDIDEMLVINGDGTRLVGAGMWHTTLYFSAPPDSRARYSDRGIKCSANNCGVSHMSLRSASNVRYYNNNPSYQIGKGFMGSWGSNSTIDHVRVDHFECGAWIADYEGNSSRGLRVTHCRFRNNYADGINLCSGTQGAVVSHCSFRNNGDDDQAVWSTGNWSKNNEYAYNTAENNWRASSLGFFGGEGNHARNIAIFDAMECGARINGTFQGMGFGQAQSSFEEISIYRSGCKKATTGVQGDFWGNANPALWVMGGYFYEVKNVLLSKIDIYDSRFEGVRVQSDSGRAVNSLTMEDIHVDGVSDGGRAFTFYTGLRGSGTGSRLSYANCDSPDPISSVPSGFDFTYTVGLETPRAPALEAEALCGGLRVVFPAGVGSADVTALTGARVAVVSPDSPQVSLSPGMYIVSAPGMAAAKVAVR